ncbi:MAG: DUF1573 domain-containing protein [Phycisphaerales bacterium]
MPRFAPVTIATLLLASGAAWAQAGHEGHNHAQPAAQPPAATTPGQPPAAGQSKIEFATLEHDWGRVTDTADSHFEFKFTNKGSGTLVFTSQPRGSCGCTVPSLEKLEYSPGESGAIKVTFHPQGKHGDQNQRITVNTNDPTAPELTLKIHAFVRTTVAFDPPLLSFGEVPAGGTAKQVVRVNGPAPDFKINYASTSRGRYVTVKVLDTKIVNVEGEDVSQTTLELSLNGNSPRGTLAAVTTVRTNNEKYPLADLQVSAEIVGDLQILPPRVNVGIVEPEKAFTKIFRVSSRGSKPFKITGVEQRSNLPSQLEVNVTPASDGNGYQVEVKGNSPSAAMPITATISLATDQPLDPKLEVQVNGAVRAPMPAAPPALQDQLKNDPGQTGPGAPVKPATPEAASDVQPAPKKPN